MTAAIETEGVRFDLAGDLTTPGVVAAALIFVPLVVSALLLITSRWWR